MQWAYILRYFYLLGTANALFFSILIFAKPKLKLTDKLLAWWLIILSLQLLAPFLYLSDLNAYYQFAGLEVFFYAIHPLLLYLYIKAMTGLFPSKRKLTYLILTSFILELFVLAYFLLPAEERLDLILGKEPIKSIYYIFFVPVVAYFIAYFVLCYRSLRDYKINILHIYSYNENVDLLWLRRVVFFFYGLLLSSLPLALVFFIYDISVALGDYFYFAGLTIFIFFLGFWGYKQGQVFNLQPEIEELKTSNKHKQLSETEAQTINNKARELEEIMQKEKPYLNPALTIFELSKLIDIQPHQLSKLINKAFNCNFFEYVNRYRIEYFKKQVISGDHKDYTLLAIALDCGFNSKSAFNRIFKEQTGTTPGEFKKHSQN